MEQLRLLKLEVKELNYYSEDTFEFDLLNKQNITNYNEDSSYYNIKNSVYLPKYIAITGVNATGKTLSSVILSKFIDFYFYGNNINSSDNDRILLGDDDKSQIESIIYFTVGDSIHKVVTQFE